MVFTQYMTLVLAVHVISCYFMCSKVYLQEMQNDDLPLCLILVAFIKSVEKLQIWAALNSRALYMDT